LHNDDNFDEVGNKERIDDIDDIKRYDIDDIKRYDIDDIKGKDDIDDIERTDDIDDIGNRKNIDIALLINCNLR